MNPLRHTRSVRLRLRPGADPSTRLRLPAPAQLDLAVRRDWLRPEMLAALGPGGVRVRLTDADLRFPCPVDPPSTLHAFGVRWAIDHRAIPIQLSVNAWVVVEAVEERDGPVTWVRGRIEAGSLRLSGLDQQPAPLTAIDRDGCPLDQPFAQVWPAMLGPVAGLVVGRAALQLDVLDEAGGTPFRRRVEPVGVSDDGRLRLWRMAFCAEDHGEPPLERPAERIRRKLASLVAATAGTSVRVLPDPDPTDVDLAYAVRIDSDTGLAEPDDPALPAEQRSRELIRPGVTLSIAGAGGLTTTWRPASLTITDDVEFTDRDEFARAARFRTPEVADGAPPPPVEVPADAVQLRWSAADLNLAAAPRLATLPPLGFAGPDDATIPGTGSAVWHVADLDLSGTFPGGLARVPLRAALVRLRMDRQVRAGGEVGEAVPRLPGWSGTLRLEGYADAGAGPWRLSVDVPDAFAPEGRALAPPRVRVRFTTAASGGGGAVTRVELRLLDARVTAVTPPVQVFAAPTGSIDPDVGPLTDPEALPHWPPHAPASVLRPAGLVFRDTRPLGPALRARPSPDGAALRVDCGPADGSGDAALAFVPAHRAFVDPASPGQANVPSGRRDQSHGLVPLALRARPDERGLVVPASGGRAAWSGPAEAVSPANPAADALPLALLPWAAALPLPLGAAPAADEPLAIHHRNLALEPAEFAAAAGDRVPPGQSAPPLPLPRPLVVRAVRDRYTLAAADARTVGGGPLQNWLQGAILRRDGIAADLRLVVPPEPDFPFERPEIRLHAGASDAGQVLSLATRCRFLAFAPSWQAGTGVQPPPGGGAPPTPLPPVVDLADASGPAGAANSMVNLLFEAGVSPPRASLDNLGVVRARAASEAGGWRVAERVVGERLYLAVSYSRPGTPLVRLGSTAGGDLTEVDFACDGLLFERDPEGGTDDFRPAGTDAPLSLGSWWAFSSIEGTPAGVDRWPSLAGAPFYALEVAQLTVRVAADASGATLYTPAALVLRGVLPNPSELTDDAFDAPPAPGAPTVVRAAAARGDFLDLAVVLDGSATPALRGAGRFNWPFRAARQGPAGVAVPGRLVRLAGDAEYDGAANTLVVRPEAEAKAISAFGRQWPTVTAPPPLTARATFDGGGRRTDLAFTAADPAVLTVALARTPVFQLPVALETAAPGEFRLDGTATSADGMLLSVQPLDAHGDPLGPALPARPEAEQGLYSTFLLEATLEPSDTQDPGSATGAIAQVARGTGVLAVWPEGDLEVPRLGALVVRDLFEDDRRATLGASLDVGGPCRSVKVLASTAGASGDPVWQRAEYVTWRLRPRGGSPAFELLLVDQYLADDLDPATDDPGPPPAAWLTLRAAAAQGPLRLRATRPAADLVRFDPLPSWYLAAESTVPSADQATGLSVLTIADGASVRAETPESREPGAAPERARLTFDGAAFVLERLDPEEVPLDACLDGDASRPALAPGRRAPRVALAGERADALRLALPATDRPFAPEPARPPEGGLRAPRGGSGLDGVWALAPLVQTGDRLLARRPRALPRPTTRPGPKRVENALLAHRPPRLGAAGNAPAPPADDPDTTPPGFPDPVAPLVGLFSASGFEADAPLLDATRVGALLERTGSAGLALRRILTDEGEARYQVVRSPFYDRHEAGDADLLPVPTAPSPGPAASSPASGPALARASRPPAEDDPRRRPPAEVARLTFAAALGYDPDPLPPPPADADPCTPARAARLVRRGDQPQDADGRPRRLFLREVTAFEGAAGLPFVPAQTPADLADTFLPGAVEILWAADKPGGMIQNAVQPRTLLAPGSTALGALSDWAQRDPQRFQPPTGAAVELTRGTFLPAADLSGLFRADLAWDDVLGTVLLDDPAARPEPILLASSLAIRVNPGSDGYLLETTPKDQVPLRLITVIDQEVVELRRDDAAFPVAVGLPPRIFLVAAFAGLTDPLTAGDGTIFSPRVRLVFTPPDGSTTDPESIALGDLFGPPDTAEGLTFWTFRPGALTDDQCVRLRQFELVWLTSEGAEGPEVKLLGEGNVKTIKRLNPSPVAPSVAVVAAAGGDGAAPFQRTLAFGPSAAPNRGTATIIRDGARRLLRYAVADAAVAVTPAPPTLGARRTLTLVKYLPDGQTLFDVFDA